jgi:hypothetical protein
MIVIRIKGGIGNQLFQYASAKGLAISLGHRLKIDSRSGFRRDRYDRSYRLHRFALPETTASPREMWLARVVSCNRWLRLRNVESKAMLQEGEFFLPGLAEALRGPAVYVEAYLQSPCYFAQIEDQLRCELVAGLTHNAAAQGSAELTDETAAVSVHVRRKNYGRLLPVEYYRRAVDLIRMQADRPHFFIFGDDPGWAASQLRWLEPKTVVQNESPDSDLRDLALMASCRHHVIANSSFSWWGAWLAGARCGLVVAPAWGWTESGCWPKDLFPAGWKVI